MKQLNKKIIKIIILFAILNIWFNILYINNKSLATSSEDIYDVILFWGQSNMAGNCKSNEENRYNPSDEKSVLKYSKETGIDKNILANNGKNRNEITISQENGTVFEYLYSKDTLQEINSNTKKLGEKLYYQYDDKGNLTKLGTEANESNLEAMTTSNGINMIPEFGKIWYKNTGHKVIAVFCAYGGQRIEQFLPKTDPNYPTIKQRYMYEAIKTKWEAAIEYLSQNNYKIGNKIYVACQGEANLGDSKDNYKSNFKKVHDNMKKDLGITVGAIVETTTRIGIEKLTQVENKHRAYEELIRENKDIILGSSYIYDRFVPAESQYSLCNTKVCYDSNGNKLPYNEALEKASKSVDYDTNTIHLTSVALSQIGKESAEALSKIDKIHISKLPNKTQYIQNRDRLDVSGGEITIGYLNIKDEIIPLNTKMITGFDNSKLGQQTLKVKYGNTTMEYNIEIVKRPVAKIEIYGQPTKREYLQGDKTVDVTGGKLNITYDDGTTEIIDMTPDMVQKFDSSILGNSEIIIKYEGKTVNYSVKINSATPPDKGNDTKDDTTAKANLPKTGAINYILLLLVFINVITISACMRYNKFKNI